MIPEDILHILIIYKNCSICNSLSICFDYACSVSQFDYFGNITFNSVMGTDEKDKMDKKNYPIGPDGKRLKPCCACPETKKARDACVIEKGEENCSELIEAHKTCMRNLGFNI